MVTFSRAETTQTNGTTFANEALFFHGAQKTVVIRTSGVTEFTSPQAKTLAGTHRVVAAFFATSFREDNFSLTYNQERSVLANIAQKTVDAVKTDLIAELDSRGYGL